MLSWRSWASRRPRPATILPPSDPPRRFSNASRLAAACSSASAGAPVELERPSDPEHGDYATNVALRLAATRRRRRASSRRSSRARAAELDEVERAEVAGPGFVNLWLAPAWFGEALGEILEAGLGFGGGSPERRERDPGRDGLGEPDRADHRRLGAERRVRRLGRAPARVRRARGRARVLLQRRRRADGALRASVEAVRRGEEPPEDGYQGDYVAELAAS